MAYRRRRTYRRRTYRRKAFSKRQAKAIMAIAKKPVETKHRVDSIPMASLYSLASYVSGPTAIIGGNIFSGILRTNSTSESAHSVDGMEFHSVGVKFWMDFQTVTTTGTLAYDTRFRFTVYSSNDFTGSNVFGISPTDDRFDPDFNSTATILHWDTKRVNILKQISWKQGFYGDLAALSGKTIWVPITGRKTIEEHEGNTTVVGELKGRQYYWTLEIFSPGQSASLVQAVDGQFAMKVYFKDP